MKLLKYTFFLLISLLLSVQAIAQPDTRRMNISIGTFSASATSYDYEGAIGVVGSTGYDVDDIEPGDTFWDDLSRYQVDSVDVIVAGSTATVWVTDLYSAGAPQSGKGTLGKPSPKTGVQPMTENGSNFITEAQEAKIMTDNLNRLDSLGGDGNGIFGSSDTVAVPTTVTLNDGLEFDDNGGYVKMAGLSFNDNGIGGEIGGSGPLGFRFKWQPQWPRFFIGDEDEDDSDIHLMVDGSSNREVTLGELYGQAAIHVSGNDDLITIGQTPNEGVLGFLFALDDANDIIHIGDANNNENGTLIVLDDDNEEIKMNTASFTVGDHLGNANSTKLVLDDSNRSIELDADSTWFNNLLLKKTVTGNLGIQNYTGRWDIEQDGKQGDLNIYAYNLTPSDPYGMRIEHDASTRLLTIGDYAGDFSGARAIMDDLNRKMTYGFFGEFGLLVDKANDIVSIGDFEFEGNGSLIKLDDDAMTITIEHQDDPYGLLLDNSGTDDIESIRLGDIKGWRSGMLLDIRNNDDDMAMARLGDVDGNADGTLVTVDENANTINLNGDAGTTVSTSSGTIASFTNAVANIVSSGTAQGNIISSGASSLPSSISQISGADTAQVYVQATNGLTLKSNKYLTIDSDSVFMDGLDILRYGSGSLAMVNNGGAWNIQQGPTGTLNVYGYNATPGDPVGMFVTGSTGAMILGDRDLDVHGSRMLFEANGNVDIIADAASAFSSRSKIITIGDWDGSGQRLILDRDSADDIEGFELGNGSDGVIHIENDDLEITTFGAGLNIDGVGGTGLYVSNNDGAEILTVSLGENINHASGYGVRLREDAGSDSQAVTLGLDDQSWSATYIRDADLETHDFVIGDNAGTKSGTKIAMSDDDAEITINANSGTTVSGSGYTYDLPVTTPASADSLYRQMVWKEGEKGVFQINNGSNYRSAESSGNIFPYDDYVEVFPNVTVSLPAPSVGLVGKKFTLIGSGATSGGSPGTVDVVDGSSTIETGSSLTIDNAFEAYSLICNGSQWIILNNKP